MLKSEGRVINYNFKTWDSKLTTTIKWATWGQRDQSDSNSCILFFCSTYKML